jgi:hypothetical protein
MKTDLAIPRPSWEYAREPFDPNLTFTIDGQVTRYVSSPLDEHYVTEPLDSARVGGLPPEEWEVRDHLTAAAAFRRKVTARDFLWSQFFRATPRYEQSRLAFARLEALCKRSREHRAAFLRMGNGSVLPEYVRSALLRMVHRSDSSGLR